MYASFNFIQGMALGIEFVEREMLDESAYVVIYLFIVRIVIEIE